MRSTNTQRNKKPGPADARLHTWLKPTSRRRTTICVHTSRIKVTIQTYSTLFLHHLVTLLLSLSDAFGRGHLDTWESPPRNSLLYLSLMVVHLDRIHLLSSVSPGSYSPGYTLSSQENLHNTSTS